MSPRTFLPICCCWPVTQKGGCSTHLMGAFTGVYISVGGGDFVTTITSQPREMQQSLCGWDENEGRTPEMGMGWVAAGIHSWEALHLPNVSQRSMRAKCFAVKVKTLMQFSRLLSSGNAENNDIPSGLDMDKCVLIYAFWDCCWNAFRFRGQYFRGRMWTIRLLEGSKDELRLPSFLKINKHSLSLS